MQKTSSFASEQPALTKRALILSWRRAFGEPPPIIAAPQLVAAIIDEYAAPDCRLDKDQGGKNGP